ncbi:MarR family transcriptional regulator [Microbacterium mangrovi]|uniref:MarR family transcriptional regulator n=1 Tax=Microbacterium mangrovi TaxID=1348253 RepID=A0A0B2AAW3_9MICO|nr:MarR family transcriptional regulator [Microbacterium mangrovi]KHK98717.1 MarR family transcriptional regulator [Microbacterium mangrovi]
MAEKGARAARQDSISENLYEVDSADPRSQLVDRSGLKPEEVAQIGRLMKAIAALRETEKAVAEASQRYMRLSAVDMRALHYLIIAKHQGDVVSPGMLAGHLGISAASTTKLLNRLENGGHIVRAVHPLDRRAFAIEVTPETEASAMETVGRQQSRRFFAAARLTHDEREVVIRFLEDMAREMSLTGVDWAGDAHG